MLFHLEIQWFQKHKHPSFVTTNRAHAEAIIPSWKAVLKHHCIDYSGSDITKVKCRQREQRVLTLGCCTVSVPWWAGTNGIYVNELQLWRHTHALLSQVSWRPFESALSKPLPPWSQQTIHVHKLLPAFHLCPGPLGASLWSFSGRSGPHTHPKTSLLSSTYSTNTQVFLVDVMAPICIHLASFLVAICFLVTHYPKWQSSHFCFPWIPHTSVSQV